MPLYEYKCHSCGKTFEVIQKFSDEPLKTHQECGGPVERLISAPAFHLKGTGWYVTDYGKGSNGKPAKSEDSKSETKAEKSDTSTTKPESASSSGSKSAESKSAESKSGDSTPAATK
jgi:putative FmdB family regulatory protein